MEEEKKIEDHSEENSYIRIKKFKFIMLIFLLVFSTAGITLAALSFGDEKAATVAIQERKEFSKLYEAFDMLDEKYFEKVDHKKLIDGAISGMVKALDDPYSDYMTKEENEKFQESIAASFQGIGAEIQEQNGDIVVVSPIKGSPAEKAGIKPNDKIITVDDKNIQGMTANEAVLLIRGEKGTNVTLGIQRPENPEMIKMTITRDDIPINTVYAEMLDNGVAKIQITTFSKHTYDDLAVALKEMQSKGMKSLIVDLRRNPGGLLDQAIEIANLFVPEGKNIVQVEYRDGTVEKTVAQSGKKIDVPTVVLIDKGSASASEILAGAVSETSNIPLIGEKSFGKGTVQTANDFNDGSNVKYTMAKWLTPNGNWIHKKGIEPNYKVSLPEYANVSYIDPDKKLHESSASNDVKSAEEMLNALGYKPGKIDGFYDSETEKAVKEFQNAEKLKKDGILTGETTIKLMNKLSEHIQKNDPQVKKAIEVLTKSKK
ncbi:lmo1851 family serine protease [Lederbergia citri]|uniref:C-terminal processing peptidase n=1 Tax=Lederbergia citri TaxID=2833580 RepID=A0A942TCS5_9BACI|nr:S41 family peptidase [Lederbergia citri]MBS4194416.1 peptidoglycan-binding protein [Lederbergia citri]